MDGKTWNSFRRARERFRAFCAALEEETPGLRAAQQKLVSGRDGPAYAVETPVLYNSRMDGTARDDDIKLILVADNPGRREQAAEIRRYLAGPSGKLAARFFREHPELGMDFDRNVLILNKTPVHTPRTQEIRELCRLGGNAVTAAVERSQLFMAELLLEFQRCLSAPVWITGYSEMKKRGIFETYTGALVSLYGAGGAAEGGTRRTGGTAPEGPEAEKLRGGIFLYRHFSMNQFTVDLARRREAGESLPAALERIGSEYRRRILGW